MMSSIKEDNQERLNKIAEEGGLQVDNRQFYDPIYQSWMWGRFLRRLFYSTSHPILRIIISLTVFLIPGFFVGILLIKDLNTSRDATNYILTGGGLLIISLYIIAGLRLLVRSYKDLNNRSKVDSLVIPRKQDS